MDADSFNELALRVIAGEATDDDRRALEAACAAQPSLRENLDQLKITHDVLRTAAPMSEAARATTPELPAHRVNELRTAVRQHFGPAANREKNAAPFTGWIPAMRWLFGGCGVGVIAGAVVIFCFANSTIEVGLYKTELARTGDHPLTAADVPAAQFVTFDQDAPFDQWQSQPLQWNERAKIWIDNERDLLHIVHRVSHGHVLMETQPLAATNDAQREQIRKLVESLKN